MKGIRSTIAAAAVGALALAACHHPPVAKPTAAIYTAKQACEIDTLAREHEVVIDKLETVKDVSSTIAGEKLLEYRAEIDASYRFVVEHCTSYNLCMQAHNYAETACSESRQAWEKSHQKFNDLASTLAYLEAPPLRSGHKPRPKPDKGCGCDEVFTTGCCNENY